MSEEPKTAEDGILGKTERLADRVGDYARSDEARDKLDSVRRKAVEVGGMTTVGAKRLAEGTKMAAAVKSKFSTTHPAMKALFVVAGVVAYVMMSPLFRGLCFLAWAVYFLWSGRSWRRALIVLLVYAGLLTFGHLTRGPRRGDHLTVNNRFIRAFGSREVVEDLALKYHAGADRHYVFDSIRTGRDLLLLNGSKFLVLEVSGDVAKVALEQPGRFSETDGGEERPVGDSLPTMYVFLPDLYVARRPLAGSSHP